MANFPALPLWTDAYLADTAHLSDAENGLYVRLLILIWRSPKCRIPNDDSWLSRRFSDVGAVRALIKEFCFCDGNWIKQKRLFREWKYVNAKRLKQSDNAKSRWRKEKDLSHGNAPTPTPTPEEKENGKGKIIDFVVGKRAGNGVTIQDPIERVNRFKKKIAENIPLGNGWDFVIAASDKAHPNHSEAYAVCEQTAKRLGKKMPYEWFNAP